LSENTTKPERLWAGDYGREWTRDNERDVDQINRLYDERFGITKTALLERFLGDLPADAKILEVGANSGIQLSCLKELGFNRLYGIDIQREAIELAHKKRPELDVIEGNIFDIPFQDGFFDLVFTSGVLIHIPPEKINSALNEIVRCTNDRIYGHEYYSEEYTEIEHRGHEGVLWKADFPEQYMEGRDLQLVDVDYLEHRDSDNIDVEFSLKK